jgi:hypothetical protein
MFLCELCLKHRLADAKVSTIPMFLAISRGRCEDCTELADCDDIPSAWLPVPSPNFRYREVQHV